MLGKLMKHEWKSTYKAGCLILISLAAVTFMGWLAFRSPMWNMEANFDYDRYPLPFGGLMDLMSLFTLMFYVIILVAASIGIFVYLATHFYRTMYSGEGYLTHTLPVTRHQLLISKILIDGIWVLIVTLAIFASVMALVTFMIAALAPDAFGREFWKMFFDELGEILRTMEIELDINLSVRFVFGVICLLASPFVSLSIIYGAISLGQLFTKHRVLMAIVCYIGVSIAGGILQSIMDAIVGTSLLSRGMEEMVIGYMDMTSIVSTSCEFVLAVVMYAASYLVISRKLNLE